MFEAGFTYIFSKSLMNTGTKTELISSDIGSVFIFGDLNPKRVRSVKKTVR